MLLQAERRVVNLEKRSRSIKAGLTPDQKRTLERYLILRSKRWPIPPRLEEAFRQIPRLEIGGVLALLESAYLADLPPVLSESEWLARRPPEYRGVQDAD